MIKYKKVTFFSKNDRSFDLFRRSWVQAFKEENYQIDYWSRGLGFLRLLKSLINFSCSRKNTRLIFGTSEICLYSILSRKKDIFVFTGLGRLLQSENIISSLIISYLKLNYRGQEIIVLNSEDYKFMLNNFKGNINLINGEGYKFKKITYNIRKKNVITLAYAGRIIKSKGVDLLVEKFIESNVEDFILNIYGDFDFGNKDSINKDWFLTQVENSKKRINYHGFIDDISSALQNNDIYVSFSEREGLPFSVLEAIEAGNCIVLSPVAGHLSFVNYPGVYYIDSNGFVDLLQEISKNPDKYLNFDRSQRLEKISSVFGLDIIVQKIKKDIINKYC